MFDYKYVVISITFTVGLVCGVVLHTLWQNDLDNHVRREIFSECLAILSANPGQYGSEFGSDTFFIDDCVSKANDWVPER